MEAPVNNKRRSIWRLLFRPSRQARLTMGLLVAGAVASIALVLFFLYKIVLTLAALAISSPQVAEFVQARLSAPLALLVFGQLIIWAVLLVFGALATHRFFGPIIPLVRQLERLERGDYSGRVHLRKGDELEEIAGALNALSERLEKKG
jgi:HAMP domain-containing protein